MTETMVPNGGYIVSDAVAPVSLTTAQALGSGGVIDVTSIAYANITSAYLDPATDLLTVYSGSGASSTVQLSGDFQGASIALVSDNNGGTNIFDLGVAPEANDPVSPQVTAQQTLILAGSHLQFVNTLDSSVGQGFENAIVSAEAFYQARIASTATLNFSFQMSPLAAAGQNSFTPYYTNFSQLQTALAKAATSAADIAATGAMKGLASTFGGTTFAIAQSLAVVLGLPGADPTTSDTTELSSGLPYFYDQSAPAYGAYDAVAILEHEISEGGLGRIGGAGGAPNVMDLFRYAAPGVPDASLGQSGRPAYFSVNGTQMLTEFHSPIGFFGLNDGADSADWDPSSTGQQLTYIAGQSNQYDAYGVTTTGLVGAVTYPDLLTLDVIGWTLSSVAPITTVSSGQTVNIAAGEVDSGVTVQSGGTLNVGSAGTAQAIVVSGGIEFVLSGGLDIGATLEAGGEQVVSSGASASGVVVQSGGFQLVRSNGYSSGTTVMSGGLERFYSGALASNLVVSSGGILGTELIVPGGTSTTVISTTATDTTVVSGVTVMSGGVIETQAATVQTGGFLVLPAGDILPGLTTVSSGGTLSGPGLITGNLFDYGLAEGVVISGSSTAKKAYLQVEAGGTVSGITIEANGVLSVYQGGGVVQALTLRAGATLDLGNVVATGAHTNAANQLIVTSGGATTDTLDGVTAPGLLFKAVSDGTGGTNLIAYAPPPDDFNGDGLSDILWRNSNGTVSLWSTSSGGGHTAQDLAIIDPSWVIQLGADFNGDGVADILWRNANGEVSEWLSKPGGGYTTPGLGVVPSFWTIQAAGDFNGDGLGDILWRNANGTVSLWFTGVGGGYTSQDLAVIDSSWSIQFTGDFNGDGKADILWRKTSGEVSEWLSTTGTGFSGFTTPGLGVVPTSWTIEGVADFNGDGLSDLLWRDTNGTVSIWVTTGAGGYAPQDIGAMGSAWSVMGVRDFNGDGKADVLWRNTSTGDVTEWLSNSGQGYAGFTSTDLGVIPNSWTVAADRPPGLTAKPRRPPSDFNGDALSDILWRNANGTVTVWYTGAGGGHTFQDLAVIDPSWVIQLTADFNGDGQSDILWRNANGEVSEWLSKPGGGYTTPGLGVVPSAWTIQGAGDFDGDGLSDVLWRNTNGTVSLWFTAPGGGYAAQDLAVIDASWKVQFAGDFNGDGKADILWRNTSGEVSEWLSTAGTGFSSFTTPGLGVVPTSWTIEAVGDLNGDGLSDLLWRNTDGTVSAWFTTGPGGYTPQDIGTMGSAWSVMGVRDFNGDGKADVLWRNTTTGDVTEWLSNSGPGYAAFTSADLGVVDTSWTIAADRPPALSGSQSQVLAQFVQSMAQVGGATGGGQTLPAPLTSDTTMSVLVARGSRDV